MLTVGQIVKPQGIRGEVKVITSDPSRFRTLKSVFVCGKEYGISAARISDGAAYVKLDGVDDRTAAESLRGAPVEIERSAAPELSAGEFYVSDVTGVRLVARYAGGERELGVITRVDSFGAADVFSVQNGLSKEKFSFPFVKALCAELDEAARVLSVDGKTLDEVAVYED